MNKKLVSAILLAALLMITGCGASSQEAAEPTETVEEVVEVKEETNEATEANAEKIVVDDLGYEVLLPDSIERVVIADLPPLVHAYYVANGSVDGLVGAPSNNALVNTMLPLVYPEVKDLSTGFRDGGNLNMEALLALEPDVIFYRSDNEKSGEMIRNSGVPAVAVTRHRCRSIPFD